MTSRLQRPWLVLALLAVGSSCNCGTVRLGQTRLTVDIDPDALDFGTVRVGQSAARTATLTNTSAASLFIERPELTGDGAAQYDASPNTGRFEIRPGQTFSIDVIFQPTRPGSHGARLQVSTTADATPEVLLPIVGIAVTPSCELDCPELDASVDGGSPDSGAPDAGSVDSGSPDAGLEPDAGVPDAGTDAGTPTDPRGTCGSANASEQSSPPDHASLCTSGTPTPVTGTGPYQWTCEGAQGTASCSTALYFVTQLHEELRSVPLGRPGAVQRFASTITRAEFVNNSPTAVTVRVVPRDPLARFMWSSGVSMSTQAQVSGVVQPGARVGSTLLWNSGDDTGTSGDPCGRTVTTTGVEYWVGNTQIAFVSIHAAPRPPFMCPGGLVTWSATSPNSGGPCRAMVGSRLENLASNDPLELQATSVDSDPGYSGAQGWTCNAATFAPDSCGAVIPTSGQPLMAYARNAGPMACSGP